MSDGFFPNSSSGYHILTDIGAIGSVSGAGPRGGLAAELRVVASQGQNPSFHWGAGVQALAQPDSYGAAAVGELGLGPLSLQASFGATTQGVRAGIGGAFRFPIADISDQTQAYIRASANVGYQGNQFNSSLSNGIDANLMLSVGVAFGL